MESRAGFFGPWLNWPTAKPVQLLEPRLLLKQLEEAYWSTGREKPRFGELGVD